MFNDGELLLSVVGEVFEEAVKEVFDCGGISELLEKVGQTSETVLLGSGNVLEEGSVNDGAWDLLDGVVSKSA